MAYCEQILKHLLGLQYIICSVLIIQGGLIPSVKAEDQMARTIMEKVDARDDGDNLTCKMEMQLIDRNQNIRKRIIQLYVKDFGKDTYTIQFFVDPPDLKNTAFLSFDYDGNKDDDQWLYLPALRRTKRIATDDKTSSYMGSDFTYADLTKIEINDYDFRLLKEDEVNGQKVWIIESHPKTEDIVKKYGYDKSIIFIRKDNYVLIRAILWVHKSNKLKYMDVISLKKIDTIWTAETITMTTKKDKQMEHKTILNYYHIQYNQPLTDQTFTVRRMEKGL